MIILLAIYDFNRILVRAVESGYVPKLRAVAISKL